MKRRLSVTSQLQASVQGMKAEDAVKWADGEVRKVYGQVPERGPPGPLNPVVLSAAKDLIAACYRHEILRFAQDDSVCEAPT